jgi:hypothetical protein
MRQIVCLIIILPLLFAVGTAGVRNFVGEVATLYTTDAGDRAFTTKLWVVEHNHKVWIRSLRPESKWLDRVAKQPKIQLERSGAIKSYRATVLAHRREPVNAMMAEQYGWADWLLGKFEARNQAVPIYLDPFG